MVWPVVWGFPQANTQHALLQLHKLGQNREGFSSRDSCGKDQSGAAVPWAVLPRCCHPS